MQPPESHATASVTSSLSLYLRLLRYVRPYAGWFAISILGFFIFASSQPMLASVLKYFVDGLVDPAAATLAGVPLMSAPNEVYYEMLEERLPGHGEPIDALQTRGILMDGSTDGGKVGGDKRLLLQIFSETLLGPVFFEFIQRKNDEGFGEGNFKALFESLERDQIRRGALVTEA